jgi:hypothetical protein
MAITVEERFQGAAQFLREIVVVDGAEQGDRAAVRLHVRKARRASRQMKLELGVLVRRQLAFNKVGQQPHHIRAT